MRFFEKTRILHSARYADILMGSTKSDDRHVLSASFKDLELRFGWYGGPKADAFEAAAAPDFLGLFRGGVEIVDSRLATKVFEIVMARKDPYRLVRGLYLLLRGGCSRERAA